MEASQCSGATKAAQHKHRAWELPLLKPRAPRARAPHERAHCSEKPVPATREEPCITSSNKDPAQPELMDLKEKIHTEAEKLLLRNRSDGVRCRAIKQQPGLSVSKEPLIVWRSEDSLRMSGEGLSRQQSKTLQTRPQSQLGLVWSGVPGGWGWRRGRECQELCPLRV